MGEAAYLRCIVAVEHGDIGEARVGSIPRRFIPIGDSIEVT